MGLPGVLFFVAAQFGVPQYVGYRAFRQVRRSSPVGAIAVACLVSAATGVGLATVNFAMGPERLPGEWSRFMVDVLPGVLVPNAVLATLWGAATWRLTRLVARHAQDDEARRA